MAVRDGSTICVIDDDAAVRDSLEVLLTAFGFSVRSYDSAKRFFSDLNNTPEPGCLILDLDMPEMTGIEVMERLRGERRNIPSIVFTGRGDARIREDLSPVAVLLKPLDADRILQAIRTAIGDYVAPGSGR